MELNLLYLVFFLTSVFLSSVSQILLKKSAEKKRESRVREYLNADVITAYGLFFLSSFMTTAAYKGIPLSLGPVLESTGYLWISFFGALFLNEKICRKKKAGLAVVMAGIIIFNMH